MVRVLVLDAEQRSSLAVVRNLGTQGIAVVAASARQLSIAGASKYSQQTLRYPDPTTRATAFLDFVKRTVQNLAIDYIVPATDSTTLLLAERNDQSIGARVLCAPYEAYSWLSNKQRLIELGSELGVPVPQTIVAHTPQQVIDAVNLVGFPAVLKPSQSKYLKSDQIRSTRVTTVSTPEDLSRNLERMDWLTDISCLVQEFIPGHGAGVFTLYGPSGAVAWFAHQRLREKPPSGGVSVLSESVSVNSTMQGFASQLLDAANWFGPAMVEFRITPEGKPYLIEVNGRFWGSLQLACDCGVDFPYLLLQLGLGTQLTPATSYVVGRRLRWLMGDVDNLLIQLRHSSPDSSWKLSSLGSFFATFFDPRCRQEVFRWSDPSPALVELRQWIAAALL